MILIKRILFSLIFLWTISNSSQELMPSEVRNLDINSRYAEIGVKFIQNDKVLFASSKKNKTNKKRDRRNNRHLGLRLYTGNILDNGSIVNIKVFNTLENNPIYESNITFTPDFKTVYFTRNNYILEDYRKKFKKDTTDSHILKLFKASINDLGELSNISPLPINSSTYSITNPCLSPDGKRLFFISDMNDSYGGFDIYEIAIHSDGTYGKPKNLGAQVNSSKDEFFPFISGDNKLYFSSYGHGGLGELDVFSSTLVGNTYGEPVNLGAPINSKGDDFAFVYNKSKNIGYVSSTRRGGVGDADIYTFNDISSEEKIAKSKREEISDTITEEQQLTQENEKTIIVAVNTDALNDNTTLTTKQIDTISKETAPQIIIKDSITPPAIAIVTNEITEECVQIVEGYIINSQNAILDNATVTLYENGDNIGTFDLSSEGRYYFELKCNRHYRVTARLNKFEESYFEIRTTRFTGSVTTTNISLEKIPCDLLIAGKLKDPNTNRPIVNAKIYLIKDNIQIDATATNSEGSYSFSAECDTDYKISIDKYGYEEKLYDVKKSALNNSIISLNPTLNPIKCSQILNGKITDVNSGIPIINATVNLLNRKGELKETALSNSNGNFHFIIDCEEKYKIEVSSDDYISALSDFKSTDKNRKVQRQDIALTPILCLQTITGTVVNSRTKGTMANIEIKLLKDKELINTILSTSSGTFKFELTCNSNYTIIATTKDFSIKSKSITTDDKNGNQLDVSIILETKLDFELVRNQLMILTDQIDFDLDKSEIREDAAIELNKVVTIMTRNPEIKVNIGVHTDSRAPDTYNLNLSEERAQSILTFLVSKGINENRITGKGFGETQLLNECGNGVKCTETQHLVNRRIEFIVTK